MRATLLALNEELLRLKAAGVDRVSIAPETLQTLRRLAGAGAAAVSSPVRPREAVAAEDARRSSAGDAGARSPRREPAVQPTFGEKTVASTPKTAQREALPPPPTVTLPEGDKQARWDALWAQVQADPVCARSVRPGKKLVLGVGSLAADIFFCGEAPGAEEEVRGEPFVGPAGQLLTKMIAAMGLARDQVYIGNIMNWRPQLPTPEGQEQVGNRPPTPEELAYCLPYLRAQLEVVRPKVIVALGATAARGLLGQDRFKALGEVRGKWHEFADTPVMVTYHPSYILRNQSNRSKRVIWEDLLQVMAKVALPISEKQRGYFLGK